MLLRAFASLPPWLLLLPALAAVPGLGAVPRTVTALRVDTPPRIDGALSEEAWLRAPVAGDFFRVQQTRGVAARLRTEAMVLYDDAAIYIAFRCYEPDMGSLRETLTRRDSQIWRDDGLEVILDTYHDRRNAFVFGVNSLGTQMDEHISNESVFTMTWDAGWDVRVGKYDDHWVAEFAIPLSELSFDPEQTTWGVNFWRAHPIDGESYSWSDTGGDFGRISEFGELHGLDLSGQLDTDRVTILPYVNYRALERQADDADAGVDLAYRPAPGVVANLTASPDFSQLESDPTQININDERELSLPERRPFFREGAELFALPLRLFYTRRVQEIDLGLKSTGKAGDYTWAAVNTYGKLIDRYDGDAKRRANLLNLRLNRDIGERAVVGVMAVQKHQSDRDVGLLSLNSRIGLHRDWTAQGQAVVNRIDGRGHWAAHGSTNWRSDRHWYANAELEEIEDGFRPNETGLEDEAYRRARG